jgi:hypothetical protein
MFRVPEDILNCSIYLYGSEEDAENGRHSGGSGFLVGIPSEIFPAAGVYIYAVTNRHVVEGGASVVRMSRNDGGVDIVQFKPTDWLSHATQDLSATPLEMSVEHHAPAFLTPKMMVTRDVVKERNIGPGDDTFLIGRFVYADGGIKNEPSVRFGRISLNPSQPILQPTGSRQESFLVESHSIGGYSGSPVFVFHHPMAIRLGTEPFDLKKGTLPIYLLGVDWGHLPTKWQPLVDNEGHPHPDGWGFRQNTGIMGVVPAWHVLDLLDREEFKEQRQSHDKKLQSDGKK